MKTIRIQTEKVGIIIVVIIISIIISPCTTSPSHINVTSIIISIITISFPPRLFSCVLFRRCIFYRDFRQLMCIVFGDSLNAGSDAVSTRNAKSSQRVERVREVQVGEAWGEMIGSY
jgi:hypothetical protein